MFKSKGQKAMWRMLYDAVCNDTVGTSYDFTKLSAIVNSPILSNRAAIYRANKQLQLDKKKILVSVNNMGYKLVEGKQHLQHANSRHDKASNQLVLANFEAKNINTSVLTVEQKAEWSQMLALNGSLLHVMKQGAKNIAMASEISNTYVQDQFKKMETTMDEFAQKMEEIQKRLNS